MPHVPLAVSDRFKGKSKRGLYGDVIMEIDWSVGEILKALKELNLDRKTLVIFTSDNGPWLTMGKNGGSAKPLRDGKLTTYEGGLRVPCIVRQPGTIPAGYVCRELATTMDLLPTFAALVGAQVPQDRKIDGRNIWPLLTNPDAKSPHKAFFYYLETQLEAVRSGKWKLILPHKHHDKPVPMALYDLENDIGEQTDVSAQHPQVVKCLTALADEMRKELGDTVIPTAGTGVRPAGKV